MGEGNSGIADAGALRMERRLIIREKMVYSLRKGSEERQKSGDRKRTVGHPEEKNSRGFKGIWRKGKDSNGPLRADTLDGIGQAILGCCCCFCRLSGGRFPANFAVP